MINTSKKAFNLFTYNMRAILEFEFLYKLFSWAIYTPILFTLFKMSLKFSGFSYLTFENLPYYFLNPITIILIVLSLSLFILFLSFEIFTLIYAYEASRQKVKLSTVELISGSFKKSKQLLKKLNITGILLAFLIVPIIQLPLGSSYFPAIPIPGFIASYILTNPTLIFLIVLLFAIILYTAFRFLFSAHIFTLSGLNILHSMKNSLSLTQKHLWTNLKVILTWNLAITLPLILIKIFLLNLYPIVQGNINNSPFIELLIALTLIGIPLLINLFNIPLQLSIISARYYEEVDSTLVSNLNVFKQQSKIKWRNIITIIMIVSILIGATITSLYQDTINRLSILRTTEITAHRGDSNVAIENTLPAFLYAIEFGAEYIEFDVQLTKDDVPVIFHDETLKRLANSNKRISDLTYEELSQIEITDHLQKWTPSTAKIPTLEEVLLACKGKVKFNIEIKSDNPDTVILVAEQLFKLNLVNDAVITSLNYDHLKIAKDYSEELITGYTTPVAYGKVSELEFADILSVEATFATKDLIQEIHRNGKLIAVWTVNNIKEMEYLMDLGVDNIITDNVSAAITTKYRILPGQGYSIFNGEIIF